MSARSDPATPLVTPREASPPRPAPPTSGQSERRRPPELQVPSHRSDLRALNPAGGSATPRQATPSGKGSFVEIGGGWARCTPGDGSRPYYWHRKEDVKQFDVPVLATEVLNKQLLRAAGEGDAKLMDSLLTGGANVNAADPTGTTPTMKVAASGDAECLRVLLSHKPNLTAVNSQGRTALHIAAFWGRIGFGTDPGCIGQLMRAGADPKALVAGPDDAVTPTQLACIGLLGDGSTPREPSTPRVAATPRSGARVRVPNSPAGSPAIKRTDVELLLSVGPDEYSKMKQAEIDAAKAKAEAEKARAMNKALAGNALRRFQSTPAGPKAPVVSKRLVRINTVDETYAKEIAEKAKQAEKEKQAQLDQEKAEEARRIKEREDAATRIQKHVRGALARMASKQKTREKRVDTLLKRLATAAQRLEAGEEFTEQELQQLAADMAELLALLKENPELTDLIRERGGYDALDVLRRTKRLLEARETEKQKAVLAAITEALRDELENLSPDELVQRAKEFGVDPEAIAAAMNANDTYEQAAQLADLMIKAIETAASITGENLLDSMADALRSELARLPTEELVLRTNDLDPDPAELAQALASPDAQAQLASLIVNTLIWNAEHGGTTGLVRSLSKLSKEIRKLLADNIESGALDALLIVEPQRLAAAVQRENDAARLIQSHTRGRVTRKKLQQRAAKLQAESNRKAEEVRARNAATCIQRHARGRTVRKQLQAKEKLRVDCATVVLRHAARLKALAMRKRKEKRLHDWSATTIQACRRGFETRRMLRQLQSEGVDAWAASGHTRAARRWFERYSGKSVEECGWLRRDQLHRLVIELRTTHGLPVIDNVVEREVREMMDGSFDLAVREARRRPNEACKLKLYHDKLSFARWLQIIRAAEQRVVPLCAPSSVKPHIPPPGWSETSRWVIEYPQHCGGDPVFPKMDRTGRYSAQNKFYPVGFGVSGRDIPCVDATHAPPVMRKPLASALWTWCGESSHFVHNNRF